MEKIGENGKPVYYFYWDDLNGKGLSEVSPKKYKQLYEDMMKARKTIRMFTPDPKAVEIERKKLEEYLDWASRQ